MLIFIFYLIFFIIGGFTMLYPDLFRILLFVGIFFNFYQSPKEACARLKEHRVYLILPVLFTVYSSIYALFQYFNVDRSLLNFSYLELFYFYLLPISIYLITVSKQLTARTIRNGFFFYIAGVFLCNAYILYALYHDIQTPRQFNDFIAWLWNSRLGGNKNIFGAHIFLEVQAVGLGIATILSLYFSYAFKKGYVKLLFFFIALLSLVLLLFTVTKSALIAMGIVLLLFQIPFIRSLKTHNRLWYFVSLIVIIVAGYVALPKGFTNRFIRARQEVNYLINPQDVSITEGNKGSVVPRVLIYKEVYAHRQDFWLYGLGAEYKQTIVHWSKNSKYANVIDKISDPHNSLLYLWLIGGVLGGVYSLYLFLLPLGVMVVKNRYSLLSFMLLIFIYVTNFTTSHLALNDSRGLLFFFLILLYTSRNEIRNLTSPVHGTRKR